MEGKQLIKHIVLNGTKEEKLELYQFDSNTPDDKVLKKFKIFARANFSHYFTHSSPEHHDQRIRNYIASYRGNGNGIEIAFRGDAKTTHLKLFVTFVILNDKDHSRKYLKVLSRDLKNAVQFTTDVYNNIVTVRGIYGDIFEKESDIKREERMTGFTTKDKVKLLAGTVGQSQRGHLHDGFRPDWVLFEDVEDRESVSSIAITEGIIQRCDEAITGLAFDGNYHVNANYISDQGVVQWFLDKPKIIKHIVPIIKANGEPNWNRYTPEKIEETKANTDDWAGEYLCDPTRTGDKFFDIALVKAMLEQATEPERKVGYTRRWASYNPAHRYGTGVDLSDGVGKDSCALVMFDFTSGEQIASADENEVGPDLFTYEAVTLGQEFGNAIIAPETNNTCGGIAVAALKDRQYPNIYQKEVKDTIGNSISKVVGWHTNGKTKPEMFYDFRRDFNDGLITINDERILREMMQFTKSDLQNARASAVTRHFDLLIATCIAYQMKDHAGNNAKVSDFYANLRGGRRLASS
jgi:hypothetical protein